MSTSEGWDLTVPEDARDLLAELARHGVRPGQRLHVVQVTEPVGDQPSEHASTGGSAHSFDFAGSFSAEPDLAEHADEYLQRDFGSA